VTKTCSGQFAVSQTDVCTTSQTTVYTTKYDNAAGESICDGSSKRNVVLQRQSKTD
jgi:hypothetical protein